MPPASVRRGAQPAGLQVRPAVTGSIVVLIAGHGAIQSHAAFTEEMAAILGSSRTSAMIICVLSGSSCFVVSTLTGQLADGFGARVLAHVLLVATALDIGLARQDALALLALLGLGAITGRFALAVAFRWRPPLPVHGVASLAGQALPLALIAALGMAGSPLLAWTGPQGGGR
ncbi:hypothetical protein ACLF3G_25800 [Falsiroseomonas sp. HC035]|uniref:hypothetical protein n=1 Tax=Falsiroseomonas sp. HC035 TaxID=3390999 RepID=UPI003D317DD6